MNAMQKNQAQVSRSDDRGDDMVPLMRMYNSSTPVKKYSPIMKLKDLSGDGKVTQKDVLIGRGVINEEGSPMSRKNKFCSGTSKPYKKSPLKRTVGVGTKSIKEKVYENGAKQKAKKSALRPSISKKMEPIPVSHTISSNIKKKR